jgi:hypothetical protein
MAGTPPPPSFSYFPPLSSSSWAQVVASPPAAPPAAHPPGAAPSPGAAVHPPGAAALGAGAARALAATPGLGAVGEAAEGAIAAAAALQQPAGIHQPLPEGFHPLHNGASAAGLQPPLPGNLPPLHDARLLLLPASSRRRVEVSLSCTPLLGPDWTGPPTPPCSSAAPPEYGSGLRPRRSPRRCPGCRRGGAGSCARCCPRVGA